MKETDSKHGNKDAENYTGWNTGPSLGLTPVTWVWQTQSSITKALKTELTWEPPWTGGKTELVIWTQMVGCYCCRLVAKLCQLFVIPLTVACQAPLSMGFSRQEYWSEFLFSPPGVFSTQGSNPHLRLCRQILHHWATRERGKPLLIGWLPTKTTTAFSEDLNRTYSLQTELPFRIYRIYIKFAWHKNT